MKKSILVLSTFLLPSLAFAAGELTNIQRIVEAIGNIIDIATPIVVGIALLAFFWGLARFIFSAGDEEARNAGKQIMIWGIIALFVMVAVWGIVRFVADALDINTNETIRVPEVPGL